MHEDWLTTAAKISNEYALAAYTIAGLLTCFAVIGRQRFRGKPWLMALSVLAIAAIAVVPVFAKVVLARQEQPFRISVEIVDSTGARVAKPIVSANVPYNVYKIEDVVQIEIAAAHIPRNGIVNISAKDESTFAEGNRDITLGADRNPSLKLAVFVAPSVVNGSVKDPENNGVSGVHVNVDGYSESDETRESGVFLIHTHAPKGSQIYLLAVKTGYRSTRQQHIVGAEATIILEPLLHGRAKH